MRTPADVLAQNQAAASRADKDDEFGRLARVSVDRAYGLARAILRDPEDAEDATHDAYVRAWRAWGKLRDPSKFDAWFDRILVNVCRSRLKSRGRASIGRLSSELWSTTDEVGSVQERDLIERAVGTLSTDHRIVIGLRFYLDLPVSSIAERLEVPEGTVNSRLHHALKRLAIQLDQREV